LKGEFTSNNTQLNHYHPKPLLSRAAFAAAAFPFFELAENICESFFADTAAEGLEADKASRRGDALLAGGGSGGGRGVNGAGVPERHEAARS
jgi:hypothetical protein